MGGLLGSAVLDESALPRAVAGRAQPGRGRSQRCGQRGPPDGPGRHRTGRDRRTRVVRLVVWRRHTPLRSYARPTGSRWGSSPYACAGRPAWRLSGEAVRAVAVLVVATPCPLLLAAPIAIMSGLALRSRPGGVGQGSAALERLAAGQVLLFDKTGTLTLGRPVLVDVITADGRTDPNELLRLAASPGPGLRPRPGRRPLTAAAGAAAAGLPPARSRENPATVWTGIVGGRRSGWARHPGSHGPWPLPGSAATRRRAALEAR